MDPRSGPPAGTAPHHTVTPRHGLAQLEAQGTYVRNRLEQLEAQGTYVRNRLEHWFRTERDDRATPGCFEHVRDQIRRRVDLDLAAIDDQMACVGQARLRPETAWPRKRADGRGQGAVCCGCTGALRAGARPRAGVSGPCPG